MKPFVSLQVLRAVAALCVVSCHSGEALFYWTGTEAKWAPFAAVGVDLFFVISGFIITTVAWTSFGQVREIIPFTVRRLVRIGFLYWLVTSIYVATTSYPVERIIDSYLLLPGEGHLIPVAWTLVIEVMFYAIVAISIPLPRALALCFVAVTLTVIATSSIHFYSRPMLFEFLFGIGIAVLSRSGVRLGATIAIGLACLGVVAFLTLAPLDVSGGRHFPMTWGLPAAMIVAAAALGPDLPSMRVVIVLAAIGDASYALYLTHLPVTRFAANMARLSHADLNSTVALVIYLAIAALLASGVAVLIYRFVEEPVLDLSKRLMARRKAA